MNKREFETANRRLGDALKRVAPELDWYDDTARAFDGYQCVWNGVASPRSFRSSHIAKSIHTNGLGSAPEPANDNDPLPNEHLLPGTE